MSEIDLCYFPTNKMCSLDKILGDEYFPENKDNVFRQETVTYEYVDEGVKVTRHVRNFAGNKHYDSRSSEIITTKDRWNAPKRT